MSWTTTTLEHAPFDIIDGDRGKNYPKQDQLLDEGYCLFLNAGNVTSDGFRFDNCQFITEDKDNALRKGKLVRNDVVLTTRGTLGNAAYFSESVPYDHVRINSGMVIMRTVPKELNPRFLYYFVRSRNFQSQVEALRSGAAQPQLPIRDIKKIKISFPELDEQEEILKVATTYDDLIENNRRRIALLEEAARLLYHEWFVQFRFPGHEHVKIVDGVPEGWSDTKLGDLVDLIKDTVKPDAFEDEDIHIGLEHIPRRSFTLSDWESIAGLASSKFRFQENDILFGKIRPYFHKVGFALQSGLVSSDAFVWRVIQGDHWPLVVCATSSDYFVAVASKTVREGSKMPRADWKALVDFQLPVPPENLLVDFNEFVRPIIEQCKKLALENRALVAARDLLLPRLMDDRIEV